MSDYLEILDWVERNMEGTDMDIEELETAFAEEFGTALLGKFDQAVNEIAGY